MSSDFSTSSPKLATVRVFFIIDMLVGVKWYLILVLIYVVLMLSDVEHVKQIASGLICSLSCLLATVGQTSADVVG